MGFGCSSESSEESLGPFWLRPARHAVRRLPGTQLSPCRNIGQMQQLLSRTFPPPSGLHPGLYRPFHPQRRTARRVSGQPPWASALSDAYSRSGPNDGDANSRQSPPLAFRRFRRTSPRRDHLTYLPGLFRPGNAPELLTFRVLFLPEIRDPSPAPAPPLPFEPHRASSATPAASKA
jgi:hypothetical protein